MIRHKNLLILLITLLIIYCGGAFWYISDNAGRVYFYHDLKTAGISEEHAVIDKGVLVKGEFQPTEDFQPKANYQLKFNIYMPDGEVAVCQTGVSKYVFKTSKIGDNVLLTYLPRNPSHCRLASSVSGSYRIALVTLVSVLMLVILMLGFVIWMSKQLKAPSIDLQERLTTHIKILEGKMKCPQCHMDMEEGFMPGTTSMHWRKKDEPIGLTPMMTGLKGTTFFFKRPILHAFHCEKCEILTFKYGREKKG